MRVVPRDKLFTTPLVPPGIVKSEFIPFAYGPTLPSAAGTLLAGFGSYTTPVNTLEKNRNAAIKMNAAILSRAQLMPL